MIAADLSAFNAPDEWNEKLLGRSPDEEMADAFPVFPEGWLTLQLFLRLATQWRRSTEGMAMGGMAGSVTKLMSIPRGIDYAAIEPTARLAGIRVTRQMFEWLQAMEAAALQTFSETRH